MNSEGIKRKVLQDYYANSYNQVLFSGIQSIGTNKFELILEKVLDKGEVDRVLELGGGDGQHLDYVKSWPRKEYISLDLYPPPQQ